MRGMYVRWAVYMLIFGLLPGLNIDNAAHIWRAGGGIRGRLPGGHATRRDGLERAALAGSGGGLRGDNSRMFSNDVLVVFEQCAIK